MGRYPPGEGQCRSFLMRIHCLLDDWNGIKDFGGVSTKNILNKLALMD
jgi:hypothetical protein